MRRSITLLAGVAVATFTVTACGSDDKDGATTPTAAATTIAAGGGTTPVETMAVDDTVSVDTADPSAPGAGTELCTINGELNTDPSPLDDESPDPVAVEEYFTTYVPRQMARLTAAAPDELQDEAAALVAGIDTFTAVLESHAWDADAAYDDPKMVELFAEDSAFAKAAEALDTYCGVHL